MNIDDLDFAHLKLLDALLRKRNLSEAARMLEIPQPTASHALARLRAVLGDQLLVRARGCMEPTPRALAIAADLQLILDLKRKISGGGNTFLPGTLDREFVIACSDVGQLVVVTELYPAVQLAAPRAQLRAITLDRTAMAGALQSGEVDIAFGAFPRLEAGIHTQNLYRERYRCFAAPKHDFMRTRSLADFLASDHIVVSTMGMAHSHRVAEQRVIQALGPQRVHMTSSSFMVALVGASESRLIVTAPGRVIMQPAKKLGLASAAPPFKIRDFDVKQYWHAREHDDPAHQWLRQTLYACLAKWRSPV